MAGGASNDDDGLIAGINVTPLVDVTLVLLIIFMVTARIIANQGMPMNLPKAATGTQQPTQQIFSIELSKENKARVDSQPIANDEAILPLAVAAKAKTPDVHVVIKADTTLEYGRVIHVIDLVKRAHIEKIVFAVAPTEQPKK